MGLNPWDNPMKWLDLTIKDLGRWESVSIVERYTRSFGFQDAMRFYKAPLSGN